MGSAVLGKICDGINNAPANPMQPREQHDAEISKEASLTTVTEGETTSRRLSRAITEHNGSTTFLPTEREKSRLMQRTGGGRGKTLEEGRRVSQAVL